jgi:hypothetical protein
MKRVFTAALLLAGGALSLAACAEPEPYAYNTYGSYYGPYGAAPSPSPYGSTCGIYNSCAPKGGPMDMRGNPSGG